ncbi:MAG: hypothetical protein GY857_14725 [Desulfobacula sp.]|nr:hypothetical protein [Desulfobacula sp.]
MEGVVVNVNPGVCGFDCIVNAKQAGKRVAKITITQSDCALIKKFSELIDDISLKDLFVPLTKNPIFMAAEQAHCHLACPVPVSVVKASEVALGLAVPKDAAICFSKNGL